MGKIVDITRLERYHENLNTNVLSKKQDNITDLEEIRTGAAAGAAASADATAKANAAQAAAIEAAAADATSKANAAQAAAEATAATDATTKANAAQAAAEATASADATTKANAAQAAAIEAAATDATTKANAAQAAAKTYADGLVRDAEGKSLFDEAGSAADALTDAQAYVDGKVDGKFDAVGSAADALEDAKEYVDGKVDGKFDEKGAAAAAQTAAAADATSKANAAQAAAEQKATDLNTAMNERVLKLEAIDHEKLALDASATAVAAIVAGAESDFDTLKEVADWIASDTQGSAELQTTVSGHTESINTINGDIDALEANKQDNITDLDAIRSGAAAGATALQADDLEYATNDDIDGLFS